MVIADRGYPMVGEMAAAVDPAGGSPCDFITSTARDMLRLETEGGETFDLIGSLRGMQADEGTTISWTSPDRHHRSSDPRPRVGATVVGGQPHR